MHSTVFYTLAWLFLMSIVNIKADKHYELHPGCESWHSSLAACADKGGKLAVITNRAVHTRIIDLIKARGFAHMHFWINGHDLTSEGHWTTSDGVPLTFQNWNPGQPDNYPYNIGRCGGLEGCLIQRANFKWFDTICLRKYGYICEFDDGSEGENNDNTQVTSSVTTSNLSLAASDKTVNNPDKTQPVLSTNSRYTTKTTDMVKPKPVGRRFGLYLGCETWLGSHAACIDKGGRLAKIFDNKTQSRIVNLIKEHGFDHEAFWFDAHDQTEEGTWTTYDGEHLNYHNWAPGQPDNSQISVNQCPGIENCAIIRPMAQKFKWNDVICTRKSAYICEYHVTEIEAEATENIPVVTAKPTRTISARESIITTAVKNNTNVDLTTPANVVDSVKDMVTAGLIFSICNFLLLFGLVIFLCLCLYLCKKTQRGSVLRQPFSHELDKKEKGDEFNNTIF
ncbi:macrophage mannose receptor 1-like isoform X2 [Ptychodera flava]|uniref:macrophage mannose receptor 1-like isoform X2 n=1 Tax=Ptychodera flava TaxID=63121 RepID=UPI00396A7E75